jgi:phosphoribosyl-ATP pyrophosphohydrolase/phosphoribosyl-AMP cyclohydrolase
LKTANIAEVDFAKEGGLIPVVTQEAVTGQVLMVAYANREALEKTLQTHQAHYYSRSRQKLWNKGEESGHTQTVRQVYIDCDADTLLYSVDQVGPACHTGEHGCFFRKLV